MPLDNLRYRTHSASGKDLGSFFPIPCGWEDSVLTKRFQQRLSYAKNRPKLSAPTDPERAIINFGSILTKAFSGESVDYESVYHFTEALLVYEARSDKFS